MRYTVIEKKLDQSKHKLTDVINERKIPTDIIEHLGYFHQRVLAIGQGIYARMHIRGISYFNKGNNAFIFLDFQKKSISLNFYTGGQKIRGVKPTSFREGGDGKGGRYHIRQINDISLSILVAKQSLYIRDCEAAMKQAGEKLVHDFKIFRDQCIIIRRNYNTYNDLYFSGSDRLLKETAETFFLDISEILLRDWVLHVCKLMDPAETITPGGTFENITIRLINKQLADAKLITTDIKRTSKSLLKYGSKLLPARNKIIAHLDRIHHIKATALGKTTEQELDDFLKNIQKYCDLVGWAVGVGPLDFSGSSSAGDVNDLLKVLEKYYRIKEICRPTRQV